jgi:hypothetical protein
MVALRAGPPVRPSPDSHGRAGGRAALGMGWPTAMAYASSERPLYQGREGPTQAVEAAPPQGARDARRANLAMALFRRDKARLS